MDKRIVWIKWLDSKTWSNSWVDGDDTQFNVPECISVGMVYSEDNIQIVLAQTLSEDGKLNLIAIAKGCIVECYEMKKGALSL